MAESKSAKVRRVEILNAAEDLFVTKGYEQTTTTDIMHRVGIAKGTLYYHFTSKEEILDALLERMGRRMIAKALICAGQKEEPVFERIFQVLMSLNASKQQGGKEMVEIMHQPRNELLHEKSRKLILKEAGPILTGLVQEGVEEGLCDCKYPAQTVEMVLLYVLLAFDDTDEDEAPEKMAVRIDAFIVNLEHLFGTKPGTFDFVRQLFVG